MEIPARIERALDGLQPPALPLGYEIMFGTPYGARTRTLHLEGVAT